MTLGAVPQLPFLLAKSTLLAGLISFWKMEGDSNDSVGPNNGTNTNIIFSSANGKIGQGAGFGSANSMISTTFSFTPTAFSVAWWIYPTSTLNYSQFCKANAGWGAFFCHTDSTGGCYCGTDVTNRFTPTQLPAGTVTLNAWNCFVFTFNSGTGKFYKNGNLVDTKTGMLNPTNFNGMTFGGASSIQTITGKLDETGLWNRDLTLAEVQEFYNSGAGKTYPF
jgi:hypothetical protein